MAGVVVFGKRVSKDTGNSDDGANNGFNRHGFAKEDNSRRDDNHAFESVTDSVGNRVDGGKGVVGNFVVGVKKETRQKGLSHDGGVSDGFGIRVSGFCVDGFVPNIEKFTDFHEDGKRCSNENGEDGNKREQVSWSDVFASFWSVLQDGFGEDRARNRTDVGKHGTSESQHGEVQS